jgi:hypothetical protein
MRIMPIEYFFRMLSDDKFRESLSWKGASIEVAHDALVRFTGVDFGFDVDAWYKWLRKEKLIGSIKTR